MGSEMCIRDSLRRPPESLQILSSARCPRPHSERIWCNACELSARPATLQAPRILSNTVSSPDIPSVCKQSPNPVISPRCPSESLTVVSMPRSFLRTCPWDIGCNPAKDSNKVDLPDPFTPSKPTTSPPESEKSTPRSTLRVPLSTINPRAESKVRALTISPTSSLRLRGSLEVPMHVEPLWRPEGEDWLLLTMSLFGLT